MLLLKYERKDFFNQYVYTEDRIEKYSLSDLKKVFLFFGKNNNASIQINNYIFYWDKYSDFENRDVTVRSYDNNSYTENKMKFDELKREIYDKKREPA